MLSQLISPMQLMIAGLLPLRLTGDEPLFERDDSAVMAVTDFSVDRPITVEEDRQIDDALNDMIQLGVRSLIVVNGRRIVGLITSYDIQGERPLQFLQSSNYSRHQDIHVGDIMTPWERLTGVDWERLHLAHVGDLLEIFRKTGLTHLLVIESVRGGQGSVLRGLISRARLLRQLGEFRMV